jgi:hypothetical protein
MSEPLWIPITGMITGIIGAITGIAGAVLGIISVRKVKHLKSLDLRLELRKAESTASVALSDLSASMERAKQSRERVYSATGQSKSGAMVKWHATYDSDHTEILNIKSELSGLVAQCQDLSHEELESRLVSVHRLQLKIDGLMQHYQASLDSDDEERNQLRADMRERLKPLN